MNYVSICAIAKDEALYILDWCKFHFALGIDHIYLYDNESKDGTGVIAKDVFKDKITVVNFPGIKAQAPAYVHCIENHKNDTCWLALLDCDEYLVPRFGLTIPALLKSYEEHPALLIHWFIYGSNGLLDYEPKPVVERFTKRAAEVDRHVKSIVNPRKTISWVSAHRFTHPNPAVDEHYTLIDNFDSRPEPATADIVAINHYVCYSKKEAYNRRSRPRADTGEMRDIESFFAGHDRNDVEDLTALNIWKSICQNA